MLEFLIAAAIGLIFSLRWTSFLWPIGGLLVAAITVTAALLSSLAPIAALLTTLAGYNLGLCVGVFSLLARWPERSRRTPDIVKNLSSGA